MSIKRDDRSIARLNNWLVPCCVLDLDEKERMLLTVRINRAKGSHIALRMSDLVQRLLELGCAEEYIAEQIGATAREIEILKKGDLFKSVDLSNWQYTRAWLPKAYRANKPGEDALGPGNGPAATPIST